MDRDTSHHPRLLQGQTLPWLKTLGAGGILRMDQKKHPEGAWLSTIPGLAGSRFLLAPGGARCQPRL